MLLQFSHGSVREVNFVSLAIGYRLLAIRAAL
jgi:hypothetical protein